MKWFKKAISVFLAAAMVSSLAANFATASAETIPSGDQAYLNGFQDYFEHGMKTLVHFPDGYNFKTEMYNPNAEKIPLVICMYHEGLGGDACRQREYGQFPYAFSSVDPTDGTPFYKKHKAYVVAAHTYYSHQLPADRQNFAPATVGDLSFSVANNPPTYIMEGTLQVISDLIEYGRVDTSRIYVVGESMGAYGVWDMLGRLPYTFAAAVSISGGGDPERANLYKETPIQIIHGAQDKVVSPEASRMMYNAIKEAGGTKVHYTEVPDGGHDVNFYHNSYTSVLNEGTEDEISLIDWMFEQKLDLGPADKTELNATIAEASKITNSKDYTEESWLAFQIIYEAAKLISAEPEASWADVYMMNEMLRTAMLSLEKVVNGWVQGIDGLTHYYVNGVSQKGWKKIDNKWYYFDTFNGALMTGWQQIDGKWYLLDNKGVMQTGWKKVGAKWYWFDGSGAMATGWKKVGAKWYWFEGSGAMVTGWKKIGAKWYWFEGSGAMATGWKKVGAKWYWFNSSGAMQTGWKKISSKWYWFEGSGKMIASTSRKIGNKTYRFNASGICLNP